MNGRPGKMRQTTATEVRLDHGKAAGSGAARPSVSPFWLFAGRLRSNFVATRLDEQTIAPNPKETSMTKSIILSSWTIVIMFACATVQPALADAKDNFKQGCESGNGSYLENADGTVQCNSSGGVMIRCNPEITKCNIVASIVKNFNPTPGELKRYFTRPVEIPGWKISPPQRER